MTQRLVAVRIDAAVIVEADTDDRAMEQTRAIMERAWASVNESHGGITIDYCSVDDIGPAETTRKARK